MITSRSWSLLLPASSVSDRLSGSSAAACCNAMAWLLIWRRKKNRLFVKPQDQEISGVWLRPGYSAGKKLKKGSLLNPRTKRFQLCGYSLVTKLEKTTSSLLNLGTKRFQMQQHLLKVSGAKHELSRAQPFHFWRPTFTALS